MYALVARVRISQGQDLGKLALADAVGIAMYQVSLTFGQQTVSAGASGVLVNTIPIFSALLAALFWESVTPSGHGWVLPWASEGQHSLLPVRDTTWYLGQELSWFSGRPCAQTSSLCCRSPASTLHRT